MIAAARSLLFVPGDRPERFGKAAASGADGVVLDLEDAVAPEARDRALEHVTAWLAAGHQATVRVTAVGTPTHQAQLAALSGFRVAVMLPKTESPGHVADVRAALPGAPVVPLLETPAGIRDADAVAATDGVARLALGTFDLAAELGVDPTSYDALAYARGRLVMASAAAGLPSPVDGVTARVDDEDVLAQDLTVARTAGFTAKLCIHPRQVAAVNQAFSPSAGELEWARRVLDAAAAAPRGVVLLDGAMVDAPVVTRAERIVSRARPRP